MSAHGVLAIPPELGYWSPCLVAEAVGQLAAWSAMAKVDFQRRPLAGIAGEVRLGSDAGPGAELELWIAIEHSDGDAVSYHGSASFDGRTVLELERCVGPMFPMRDYDDPDAVRQKFDILCGPGEATDRFEPLQRACMAVTDHDPGRRLHATLTVPDVAAFFADHFPRRPVYPATLLLDHQLELAQRLAVEAGATASGGPGTLTRVTNAKMRAFVLPGQTVEIGAEVKSQGAGTARVLLTASAAGRRVSTARAELRTGE